MAKNPLAGLGKCALFPSFIFAVAIWWVVAESDASAYSTPPAAGADAADHERLGGHAALEQV